MLRDPQKQDDFRRLPNSVSRPLLRSESLVRESGFG
jgi:hypothetical protein